MFDYFKMNCYNDKNLIEEKERYFFLRDENWVKKNKITRRILENSSLE